MIKIAALCWLIGTLLSSLIHAAHYRHSFDEWLTEMPHFAAGIALVVLVGCIPHIARWTRHHWFEWRFLRAAREGIEKQRAQQQVSGRTNAAATAFEGARGDGGKR